MIAPQNRTPQRLGVLGGMGPLASAEFVKTIYERYQHSRREQEMPVVMMYSDPTFPDRTESFLNGRSDEVLERLIAALGQLQAMQASQVVMCCVTLHHLLPRVPEELSGRVLSLLDVVFDAVQAADRPQLLVCTTGTRRMRIFESHPRWPSVAHLVRVVTDEEQAQVHGWIYSVLKLNGDARAMIPFLRELMARHGVNGFIAGCTEMHLVSKQLQSAVDGLPPLECLDPLTLVADALYRGLA